MSNDPEREAWEALLKLLPEDPIERARAAGIDLDLMEAQLRLTPAERIASLERRRLNLDHRRRKRGEYD